MHFISISEVNRIFSEIKYIFDLKNFLKNYRMKTTAKEHP